MDLVEERQWATKVFWSIVALHVLVWSILPELVRYAPSYDLIEAANWSQYLDWGYDKNPWVIGWITRLGIELSCGKNFLGYYFIQQLFIGLSFWSIWQLGKQLFRPLHALIAVLILEGCLYFSTAVQTNNDNFALVGFLTLATYTFFTACKTPQAKYGLITGVALGCAVMTKYSAALLMPWMLIYLLTTKDARNNFSPLGLYGGIILFLLICLPNVIWLTQHDFVTIRYLFTRQDIQITNFWAQHFYYPLDFCFKILLGILPCLLLLLTTAPFKIKHALVAAAHNERKFLLLLGLGPLATIVFFAMIFKWQLYWEWGVPFIPFLGLIIVSYYQPSLTKHKSQIFVGSVLLIMLLMATGYYLADTRWQAGRGSADYPARAVANHVTAIWQQQFHTPLRYVAGSRYVAGMVAFYSKDKPHVFAEWNILYSSQIDKEKLKKYGAVFVNDGYFGTKVLPWAKDDTNTTHFPTWVLKAYPTLKILPIQIFPYHRNQNTHEVVKLLIGILPPGG